MKIALYGQEMNRLQVHKEIMETACRQFELEMQIDCFARQDRLVEQLFQYDGVILSDEFIKQFQNHIKEDEPKKVRFVTGKQIQTFDLSEIYYIEADLKTVHIWKKRKEVLVKLPLSKVEKQLTNRFFLKVHRSYIVNGMHAKAMTQNSIILDNGVEITVSKYRYDEVREQYLRL